MSLHHYLLGHVQEDDLPPSECGIKSKVIKLADRDQVGREVGGMYGCFEGKVCSVAIIGKCAFNFAYTQNTEGSILVCSAAGTWRVICKVSCEVFSISEAVICSARVGIGPGLSWRGEECSHCREIIRWELSDDRQDV